MQNVAREPTGRERLLAALEGTTCTFCENGALVRERYKGNDAVVCAECGVPGAQVW